LINSLALLLAPEMAAQLFPWIMLPVLAGELTLSLWMIIKGVILGVTCSPLNLGDCISKLV